MNNNQKPNFELINKLFFTIISILLSIIAFFLVQLYSKIYNMDINIQKINIEMTRIQMRCEQFVTREEMITFVNDKLNKN